jgi:BRCA1-associated protein
MPVPSLECAQEACRSTVDLWMCLICGHTGCGRYRGSHAAKHFEETGHGFALEVADGRGVRSGRQGSELVWDYMRDAYVHRLVTEDPVGGGGAVAERVDDGGVSDEACELEKDPGAFVGGDGQVKTTMRAVDAALMQAKVDSVATELTQLMVSQMDMQRTYYEKIVDSHHLATERAARGHKCGCGCCTGCLCGSRRRSSEGGTGDACRATQEPRTVGKAGKEPQGAVVPT